MAGVDSRHDTECGSKDALEGSQEYEWYMTKWCYQCAQGRDYLEHGNPRPCFDAPYLGIVSIVASVFGLLGTVLYNTHLGHWSYRRCFTLAQLLYVLFGFTDLIWVQRLNVYWGISDKLFVVGQEVSGLPQANRTPNSTDTYLQVSCMRTRRPI